MSEEESQNPKPKKGMNFFDLETKSGTEPQNDINTESPFESGSHAANPETSSVTMKTSQLTPASDRLPPLSEHPSSSGAIAAQGSDTEHRIEFATLLFIIHYHKYAILITIALVFGINLYLTLKQPNLYFTKATILNESENSPTLPFIVSSQSAGTNLDTAIRLIEGNSYMNLVLTKSKLLINAFRNQQLDEIPPPMLEHLENLNEENFRRIQGMSASGLSSMIQINPLHDSNMLELSMRGRYPIELVFWLELIMSNYIEQDLEQQHLVTDNQIGSLNILIEEKEKEISNIDESIQDLNDNTNDKLKESGSKYLSKMGPKSLLRRLVDLENQLQKHRLTLRQLQDEKIKMQKDRIVENIGRIPTAYDKRINEMQLKLSQHRLRYTDENSKIKELEEKLATLLEKASQQHDKVTNTKIEKVSKSIKVLDDQMISVEKQLKILESENSSLIKLKSKLKQLLSIKEQFSVQAQKLKISKITLKSNYKIVEGAYLPTSPSNSDRGSQIFIGFLLGIVLSFIVVYILEYSTEIIRIPDEAKKEFHLNVLGMVPSCENNADMYINPDNPSSVTSEVFALLRNSVRFAGNSPEKLLLFASALQGEGKTYSSVNLAISYALEGNQVLYLNADMRKQNHNELKFAFQCHEEIDTGLSDYLTSDEEDYRKFIFPSHMDNLQVMSGGSRVPNPSKHLATTKMDRLLKRIEKDFDVVIIDGTAVLPVVDLTVISSKVRGVLLLFRSDRTPKRVIKGCIERLLQVRSPIIGMVMNRSKFFISSKYYGNSYQYYS